MPKLVHFEIASADPQKAADFYQKVFDWKIKKWDGPSEYWMIDTGADQKEGASGGIMKKEAEFPMLVNTIDVMSVDDYAKKVEEAGGSIFKTKFPVPGVGYMVYARDLDGNPFGMIQLDPEAGK